jgi:uncharacterized membrane protein YoaK (UPF0700 family)
MSNVQPAEKVGVARFIHDPAHGPLPALLLLLTATTGVMDAVSVIGLGRVFVANMTGNVAFIGFALAHVPGFSLAASVAAMLGFLAGALVAGTLVARFRWHRGLLLRNTCTMQFVLIAIALVVVLPAAAMPGRADTVAAATLCAGAMGIQNTVARRLAVPDLTTTVLTMTLIGLAADLRRSPVMTTTRRALAVLTMFLGALIGALLVLHSGLAWALAVALVLLAVVVLTVTLQSKRPASWQTHTA